MSEREINVNQPLPNREPSFQQSTAQLTPEYLDSIINNPNEHAQVKKQAATMKAGLFPKSSEGEAPPVQEAAPKAPRSSIKNKQIKKEEEPEINEEFFIADTPSPLTPTMKKEKSIIPQEVISSQAATESKTINILESKSIDNSEFNTFLSDFKNNLFNDEFSLISSPKTRIQLRSMTVSEYKFLTKQFDIYQKGVSNLDRKNPELIREIDMREAVLTNAIDTVLQRCITNQIKVYDLTLFDWIYAIVALRAISRGTDQNLKVSCSNHECSSSIRLGVLDAMKKIEDSKNLYMVNPLDTIAIDSSISLYLGIPTRGELVEAQKQFLDDPECSLSFANTSMYIRAFIKNKTTANLLSPQQRFALINVLPYDVIKKIQESVNNNLSIFYNCFDEFKCDACGKVTKIDISDFILFFYDF